MQTQISSVRRKIVPRKWAPSIILIGVILLHVYFYPEPFLSDDPRLVKIVTHLLVPPSKEPYAFANKDLASTLLNINPSGGQLQAVLDILIGFGPNGFFIDCGANDGEWYSNTLFLERTLGWEGVLIEADPTAYAKLEAKHRKAYLGHFCLSNIPHPTILPFFKDETLSALGSGLIKSAKYYATKSVDVQCIPLYTVLLAFGRLTVDFFSLDIEGSEINVLDTIPFDKVIFKVITIEHSVIKEGKLGLRKYMEARDYIFFRTVVDAGFVSGDSIFIHKSVQLTDAQRGRIGIEDSDLTRSIRE